MQVFALGMKDFASQKTMDGCYAKPSAGSSSVPVAKRRILLRSIVPLLPPLKKTYTNIN